MFVQILDHWVYADKLDQARALFAENTRAIMTIPGLIERQVLQSKSDPLKWTCLMIWEDEKALQAWREHPGHVWDRFGVPPAIPPGSEYHRQYADAGSVQEKPPASEFFEVISIDMRRG